MTNPQTVADVNQSYSQMSILVIGNHHWADETVEFICLADASGEPLPDTQLVDPSNDEPGVYFKAKTRVGNQVLLNKSNVFFIPPKRDNQ